MNINLHRLLLTPKERARVFLCENDLFLPEDNEAFDAIIIERLSEIKKPNISANVFFREAYKRLKPSGEIIVASANKLSYRRCLRRDSNERAHFSLNNMRAELIRAGFGNINIFTVHQSLDNMVSVSPIGGTVGLVDDPGWRKRIKTKILSSRLFTHFHPAYILRADKNGSSRQDLLEKIAKHGGAGLIDKIIIGKPRTAIIIANDRVIRLPLDGLSAARCRQNKRILERLAGARQAFCAPRFYGSGVVCGQEYYVESKIVGEGMNPKDKRIEAFLRKAADLICEFHNNTAKNILIDKIAFKRLFGREFSRLSPRLNAQYREKLAHMETRLAQDTVGTEFKTVWMHGDFKIENILMDGGITKISGIIDWDLSRNWGFPLVDIFYLLFNNQSELTGKSVLRIFLNRLSSDDFTGHEKDIIKNYLVKMNLSCAYIAPMLVMFFLHHVTQRYGQMFTDNPSFKDKWLRDEVYAGIDHIMGNHARFSEITKWA